MVVKKILSSSVGTHHPEQAMILTEKGEMYVTSNELTPDGYVLVPFFDLSVLNGRINALLRGQPLHGRADVPLVTGTIAVSPVASLFRVVDYSPGSILNGIEGGNEGQIITITATTTTSGVLTVSSGLTLALNSDMVMDSADDTLLLQRSGGVWKELSRSHNNL